MSSLLTNSSAQTALRTLRTVQSNLQETQDRISTGLKVRSPKENPAFFLVAQTVKGDVAVLDGLKDNMTVGVNTAKTAAAGLNGITGDINQIQTALTTVQTGTALDEVQFAIDQVVEQMEGQIDATSFNGVNLLSGQGTTTLTTSITRDNGSFELSTFTMRSQNLDSLEYAGEAAGIFTATADAKANFDNLYRAFNSGFADRLDTNGDGQVTVSATSADDVLVQDGVAPGSRPDAFGGGEAIFTFYGSQEDIDFLTSVGVQSMNLGRVGSDTNQDVIAINLDAFVGGATGALADGSNGIAMNYTAAKAAGSAGTFDGTTDAQDFADVATYMQQAVFSDTQLRAFADDSGFRAVARQIEVADSSTANVQAGFVVADSLISRVNVSATVIGVVESTLTSRQDFLTDLTDSLELGVAALTEADLTEESSRLQSLQVQEQLATQALSIANQRPQTILSLFR